MNGIYKNSKNMYIYNRKIYVHALYSPVQRTCIHAQQMTEMHKTRHKTKKTLNTKFHLDMYI